MLLHVFIMNGLKSHLISLWLSHSFLHSTKAKQRQHFHITAENISLLVCLFVWGAWGVVLFCCFFYLSLHLLHLHSCQLHPSSFFPLAMLITRFSTITTRSTVFRWAVIQYRETAMIKSSHFLAEYFHTKMWEWRILPLSLQHTTFLLAFQQWISH